MRNLQKKNIEHEKLEIINWIINIKDEKLLNKINHIKEESTKKEPNIRKFGFAKGTFTSISDDFDAPLEEFKDYMP